MRRHALTFVVLLTALPIAAYAQQAQAGRGAAPAPDTVVSGQGPAPVRVATPAPVDPRIDQSDVNIGITVTITDKAPAGTQTKTVTLIIANRESGRVRSSGATVDNRTNSRESQLNVDGSATLMKSGLIRTWLTLSYMPEWTDEATRFTGVTQSGTLFLKDGQPTVITQAADPTKGTRSVSVEVTAKVIR